MKWYWWLLVILLDLVLVGIVGVVLWYFTPLGPPLRVLPEDYTKYWGPVVIAFVLTAAIAIGLLTAILYQINLMFKMIQRYFSEE